MRLGTARSIRGVARRIPLGDAMSPTQTGSLSPSQDLLYRVDQLRRHKWLVKCCGSAELFRQR